MNTKTRTIAYDTVIVIEGGNIAKNKIRDSLYYRIYQLRNGQKIRYVPYGLPVLIKRKTKKRRKWVILKTIEFVNELINK